MVTVSAVASVVAAAAPSAISCVGEGALDAVAAGGRGGGDLLGEIRREVLRRCTVHRRQPLLHVGAQALRLGHRLLERRTLRLQLAPAGAGCPLGR